MSLEPKQFIKSVAQSNLLRNASLINPEFIKHYKSASDAS